MQTAVVHVATIPGAMPMNRVRDDGGIGRPVGKGVRDVAVVSDMLVGNCQSRPAVTQINLYSIRWYSHSPEQASGEWEDARVEIVDLCREVVKVKLTFVDIQSDKAECVVMHHSIHADIRALHEPHIDVKEQSTGSGALNLGSADEAIEVCDRGWFLTAG